VPHYKTSHVAENLKRVKQLMALDAFNITVGYMKHNYAIKELENANITTASLSFLANNASELDKRVPMHPEWTVAEATE